MNPIRLALLQEQLEGLADLMGTALARSAFSPNIRVRLDFSCALFTADGSLLAQAAHIPVHLGSMPDQIKALLQEHDVRPGQLFIANEPYQGGTHLPDITLIEPVFYEEELLGIAAARAHHADVGGATPASMSSQENIYADGLRIPILPIAQDRIWDKNLLGLILNNMRSPQDREGDLLAQSAACLQGAEGLVRVYRQWSQQNLELWNEGQKQLIEASSEGARKEFSRLFSGQPKTSFTDHLEIGPEMVPISVSLELDSENRILADFEGTGSGKKSGFNATLPVTKAAVCYVLRCLLDDSLPINQGFLDSVLVKAPKACVVNACYPLAVAAGNVETSQRIVDTVFGALAKVVPELVPAASAGSMNNLSFGFEEAQLGVHYETSGGGSGASFGGPEKAASGVQVHMTNTLATPVEVLETEFPIRVDKHARRPDSGGQGQFRGGDGTTKEWTLLAPATVTFMTTRRKTSPYGLQGGQDGEPGSQAVRKETDDWVEVDASSSHTLKTGDQFRLDTPGGGAWGTC